MDFLSSNSQVMLEKSMGFLWTKQAAILDNVSNAETPNYKAKVVTFEEQLRKQLEAAASKPGETKKTVREALDGAACSVFEARESVRMDDNGVNVTEQSVEMIRNAYQLQYVMQAISSELTVLDAAVRGQ